MYNPIHIYIKYKQQKNYQDVILHIVLQLTVNGQHGPNGVPVALHVAWACRQGAVTMVNNTWKITDNAAFHHVLVCFLYP